MFKLISIIVITGLLSGCTYRDNSADMAKCQGKLYSYDKCFSLLHGNG